MTAATDWGPAKQIARTFFSKIDYWEHLGYEDSPPLWDGKTVRASSPANLLHEVAHYQLAPKWRRHTRGYGLGIEPEGGRERDAPLLVKWERANKEEILASTLGIWWEIHLGYENWQETANEHSWVVKVMENDLFLHLRSPSDPAEFRRITGAATTKLIKLGVLGEDLTPRAVLASSWRHDSFDRPT